MKEILSTNDIALLQNVSGSRIRQIWRQYRMTKTVPVLAKPGRPSSSITNTAALPVSSNSMSYLYHLAPLVNQLPAGHNHTISTSTSSSTSSDSSGDSGHHHHNTGKNHVKSRTSRHAIYEGGGFFNGGPSGLYDFIWNFGLCAIRIIFDQ
jgi:hypothetical protein